MYYTEIKHSSHLRTLEKCIKHSPAARAFYISLVFSNACRVLSQCNTRLRLLYLLNRSQKTSKCGKNISDTLGYASCATYLFLPHFDVICDLLLNRRTATWNLFVKWYTREVAKHERSVRVARGDSRVRL